MVNYKKICQFAANLNDFLMDLPTFDINGKPLLIPLDILINFQKGATIFLCLFLQWYFNAYRPAHWLYTALHGGYGILWIIKSYIAPDKRFKVNISIISAGIVASVLIAYWSIAWLTFSDSYLPAEEGDLERCIWAALSTVIGLVLMCGADIQKHIHLSKKKELITTGFFQRTRNPNYLGEMLIYFGFAILSRNWWSYILIFATWSTLFTMGMLYKEYSFMRKQGWEDYKNQSFLLLPKVSTVYWRNHVFYMSLLSVILAIYFNGGVLNYKSGSKVGTFFNVLFELVDLMI